MLLKHKFKKLVSVITVCSILLTGVGSQTYAAVNDNVVTATVEQSLGDNIGKTFPTVFDFLQNIWLKLDDITVALNTIERKVDKQTATAGGGCYYTVYTNKSYLDGYKLKLSDGTTAKSCYIGYDPDSEYWCGVVRVPLNNDITIEIFDPGTGVSQGKMSTSAVTTSGYATINLDTLLLSFLNNLVNIDDTLALHLSSDSAIVQNDTYFPVVMKHVYTVNHDVDKFLTALNGKSYTSKTFDELLNNETEFVNAVAGNTPYRTVLSQQEFTDRLINNRSLLRQISYNNAAKTTANANSVFTSRIVSSTLAVTQSKPGGQLNEVSGNLLHLNLRSGNVLGYGSDRWNNRPNYTQPCYICDPTGDRWYGVDRVKYTPYTYWYPECYIDGSTIWNADAQCHYINTRYMSCGHVQSYSAQGDVGSIGIGKYCSSIKIPALSGSVSRSSYSSSLGDYSATVSANQSCQNSVITYIDLDAEG